MYCFQDKGTEDELLSSKTVSMVDDLKLSVHKQLKGDTFAQKSEYEIEPPLQFQDLPCSSNNVYSPLSDLIDNQKRYVKSPFNTNESVTQVENFVDNFIKSLINDTLNLVRPTNSRYKVFLVCTSIRVLYVFFFNFQVL